MSWDDVVRSMVPEGSTWEPHSLHTAEVVGSNPTTPTPCTIAYPSFRLFGFRLSGEPAGAEQDTSNDCGYGPAESLSPPE
jgi:hypothetical protein